LAAKLKGKRNYLKRLIGKTISSFEIAGKAYVFDMKAFRLIKSGSSGNDKPVGTGAESLILYDEQIKTLETPGDVKKK
jgi:hypothetical protein